MTDKLLTVPDKLLTVQQVADQLAVSRSSVYRLIWRGHLRAVDVGYGIERPRYRVTPDDLAALLQRAA